jgi:hypothetical protein
MPKKPTLPATAQLRVPIELIERKIYLIRGQKVMLDSDLAELYEAPTKVFNQAVMLSGTSTTSQRTSCFASRERS